MKIENNSIRIRDFTKSDLPLMFKWLTDDRVLEFYEGRDVRFTMDTLAETFLQDIPDGFRMIIEYKDQPAYFSTLIKVILELSAFMKKQNSES